MRREAIVAGLLATVVSIVPAIAGEYHFQKVATIDLQGAKGHGDIATYDPSNHMLYVSMPNDGLDVVDTKTNKVVAYIKNVPSPNGNAFDSKYVYVAAADGPGAGKVNALIVIDKKTWKEVGRVTTQGTSPDGVQVDPATNTVYVTSDDNNWIEKYSGGAHPKFEAKWPLVPAKPKTGPDVGTLVPERHAIFQPDDGVFEKVSTSTGAVEKVVDEHLKLTKHGGTKASVYDPSSGDVWVGTTNSSVIVVKASDLATVKTLKTHGGIDAMAFDPKLHLVYAFGGGDRKGFDVYDAKTLTPVAFVSTGIGQTHTGDVDTATHDVYAYAGDGGVVVVFKPVK